MAFLDDTTACRRFTHCSKQERGWNSSAPGENPRIRLARNLLDATSLQMAAVIADETAIVWRGSDVLPSHQRGIKVLGTPLGHPDFVRASGDVDAEH